MNCFRINHSHLLNEPPKTQQPRRLLTLACFAFTIAFLVVMAPLHGLVPRHSLTLWPTRHEVVRCDPADTSFTRHICEQLTNGIGE